MKRQEAINRLDELIGTAKMLGAIARDDEESVEREMRFRKDLEEYVKTAFVNVESWKEKVAKAMRSLSALTCVPFSDEEIALHIKSKWEGVGQLLRDMKAKISSADDDAIRWNV